jgi:hypothetical protein
MSKNDYLVEFRTNLEKLSIAELRQKASKNFGLKLTREHKATDIVDLIMSQMQTNNYAHQSEGDLKPGYARIKLSRTEGKPEIVPFNCNGYTCWIPVEVEVDVPIKVIDVLENALEMKKKKNEFDEYVDVLSKSYPYSVLATCPGPDPKPGRERSTEQKWKPYKEFQKKYGYWPSQKVLQQATAASIQFNAYSNEDTSE